MPRDCMVTIDAGVSPGLGYDRLELRVAAHALQLLRPRRARHGTVRRAWARSSAGPTGRRSASHGDGGFLYTAQEINTAVRHKIPHVTVVLNNSCHGSEKAQQMRQWNERYVGVDLENPRFDKLAEVLGGRGFYVTRPDEIADAFKSALAFEWPARDRDPGDAVFRNARPDTGGKQRRTLEPTCAMGLPRRAGAVPFHELDCMCRHSRARRESRAAAPFARSNQGRLDSRLARE